MSLDDDNHASGHKQRIAPRQSMDREFHDHNAVEEEAVVGDVGESSHSAFDDDEDSFCAASDDCAPDKEFLESILEEYHPERVNLLDQTVPEPLTKPKQEAIVHERKLTRSKQQGLTRSSKAETMEVDPGKKEKENNEASDSDEPATNGTTIDSESAEDTENNEQTTENDEVDEGEAEDSFPTTAPPRRPDLQRPGLQQRPGLEQSGDTAKKSFRSINGKNFWSKPFRRVARSMKRGGSSES